MAPEVICIGTVDAWLVWNFTGGRTHATDASNAARTQLYDIGAGEWDEQLCRLFGVVGVTLVPAHVGLGSPHWNAEARGVISGLTFGAGPAHVARAAAESMAFQVCDVVEIIEAHSPAEIGNLHVDGGPSRNACLMQMVADYLGHPVITSQSTEASALGAAFLAGLAVGYWPDLDTVAGLERRGATLRPGLDACARSEIRAGWRQAVARATIVG